ncbi:MAG: ABC transporter ATP-binding protein [Chitinophagales bacterium]|nr:ABC transporter ATP-binding protein [Chitinophagales bacterium]
MSWLKVDELSKIIKGISVVDKVSFTQNKKENIAIAGTTGSGKTTLLKMIAGLIQPTKGFIFFDNERVKGAEEKLLPGHKHIAYLSQHFELRNNYFVEDLLDVYNKVEQEEADKIYSICQITHLLKRKTNELSGGEKQRIALACQLVTKPKLLLLDEPFSNLDMFHKKIMRQVIDDISSQLEISCIKASHDWEDILPWADTIYIMQDGKIIQQGDAKEIYYKPINEYVAALSGDYNLIEIENTKNFQNHLTKNIQGKKFFLRPEQIKIEAALNIYQQENIIKRISFYGSYYMIDVQMNHQLIQVKTVLNNFSVGQRVLLSVPNNDVWFL